MSKWKMMRTGAKSPNQSHKLMGSELAELDEKGDLGVMVNSSMKMNMIQHAPVGKNRQ